MIPGQPFKTIMFLFLMATVGCGSPALLIKTVPIPSEGPDGPSETTTAPRLPPLAEIRNEGPIYSLALSPDGRYLALGSAKKIMIWDGERSGELRSIESGEHDILSLAFSPDSQRLAVGSYLTIDLLEVQTGRRETTLSGHTNYIQALTFSPDGRLLASGSRGSDTDIYIWNIIQDGLLKRLTYPTPQAEIISGLAFTPDQRWLASVGLDRTIRIWNVVRKTTDVHLTLFDPSSTPLTIAFSLDKKLLAVGTREGPLVLYRLKDGKILRTMAGHHGKVLALEFSRDGRRLISIGEDQTIRRWRVATGTEIDSQSLGDEIELGGIAADRKHFAVAGPRGAAVFTLEVLKKLPPVVTLFGPVDRQIVETSIIQLTGIAIGDQDPIEMDIQLNGALYKRLSGQGTAPLDAEGRASENEISIDEEIPLALGENVIAVTVHNSEGQSQSETIRITYRPQPEETESKTGVEPEAESGKSGEGR